MNKIDPVTTDVFKAIDEGRHDDLLQILEASFDKLANTAPQPVGLHFITMFGWSQIAKEYLPAREALASRRDYQVRCLLDGDEIFGEQAYGQPHSRFDLVVEMNDILSDHRSTYDLFIQLLAMSPVLAKQKAPIALPAMVEAGDFVLAERYLVDPLTWMDELNRLALDFPLWAPAKTAQRLATELSIFMKDVILRKAILSGLGRESEAEILHKSAIAGIADEEMRELAIREIAVPGTIMKEMAALWSPTEIDSPGSD